MSLQTDTFLDYLRYERGYSEETVKSYRNDLAEFERFCMERDGSFVATATDAETVREWMVVLMEDGYASSSVNRKLSCLRSFYRFLLKRGDVQADPLRKVSGPKRKKPLPGSSDTN